MVYAKLINNKLQILNRHYIEYNGRIYTNPINNPNLNKADLGYKELVVDALPSFDQNTQCVEMHYTETDTQIVRGWSVRDLTEEELAEREEMNEV